MTGPAPPGRRAAGPAHARQRLRQARTAPPAGRSAPAAAGRRSRPWAGPRWAWCQARPQAGQPRPAAQPHCQARPAGRAAPVPRSAGRRQVQRRAGAPGQTASPVAAAGTGRRAGTRAAGSSAGRQVRQVGRRRPLGSGPWPARRARSAAAAPGMRVQLRLAVHDAVEDRLELAGAERRAGRSRRRPSWRPRNARRRPDRSACPR